MCRWKKTYKVDKQDPGDSASTGMLAKEGAAGRHPAQGTEGDCLEAHLLFSCWLAVLPHLREPAAGSDSRLDHQEGRKKGSVQTSQGAVKETGAGGPPPSSPEGALTWKCLLR